MGAKIILTTCSLNHIAQAKTLGDSILRYAPEYQLVIGLVDRVDKRISADYYAPHILIEADALNIPDFADMCDRYTVLELNCAMKSFFTQWVLEKMKPEKLIFLDSDMLLFDSIDFIDQQLDLASILLTPHITQPFPVDGRKPEEKNILKTGMFNAGFYGLKNDQAANDFVNWWTVRMKHQCYERPKEGLNVDQKWINFVPLYFKNVAIIDHPGCNAAYWNLHERKITRVDGKFKVNDTFPLLFYHFSGYSIPEPDRLSKHQDRYSMEDSSALKKLFQIYHKVLSENNHEALKDLPCVYARSKSFLKRIGIR